MCLGFIEELGEEDIYELYRDSTTNLKTFENHLCRGKGLLGECNKQKMTGSKKTYSKRMEKEL